MLEVNYTYQPTPDIWGNRLLWLTVGRVGTVQGPQGEYLIEEEDLFNPLSINTLAGLPLYCQHPVCTVVTPGNSDTVIQVGTLLDKWRLSGDGAGLEVLGKITDQETITAIESGLICETSPTYILNPNRIYNHVALLYRDQARGGHLMRILAEGFTLNNKSQGQTTESLSSVYGLSAQDLLNITLLKNQKMDTNNLEQMIGSLAAQLSIVASGVQSLLEAELREETVMEEGFDDATELAYREGLVAGEVLAVAKSIGFSHSTVDRDTVTAAKKHVISHSFPSLAIESFTPANLDGAYNAALVTLATVKDKAAEVKTEVLVEGKPADKVTKAPAIQNQEVKAARKPRINLS